jgi:DNA-binding MarR family transcriptional regulator
MASVPGSPSGAEPLKPNFLIDLLWAASHLSWTALLRAHGAKVAVAEWRLLITLGALGTATSATIARHSHIHKTAVCRAAAALERRQLISRTANDADLRESLLSLTAAGQKLYDELAPVALNFESKILDMLNVEDRATLERALVRITDRARQLATAKQTRRFRPAIN